MSPIQSRAPEYSSKYAVTADSHCMKTDLRYKKEDSSRYTVLLVLRAAFHPQTTQEVLSYSSWIESYKAINCDIVGILRDSYESIHEWVMAPESEGGLANSQEFPIISDKAFPGLVSQLGVTALESYGDNAIIIIDPLGKIRYWAAFPPDVGRGETLNIVASIREVDRNNGTMLTPADWMEGDPVIPNNRLGIDKFYNDNYGTNGSSINGIIKSVNDTVAEKMKQVVHRVLNGLVSFFLFLVFGSMSAVSDTEITDQNVGLQATETDDISSGKLEIEDEVLKAVMTDDTESLNLEEYDMTVKASETGDNITTSINQDGDEVLKKDKTGANDTKDLDKEHETVAKSGEIHVKDTKNIGKDEAVVLRSNEINGDDIENKGQEEDNISNVAEPGIVDQDDGILKTSETGTSDTKKNIDHKEHDISRIDETDISNAENIDPEDNIPNDVETGVNYNDNKDIDQEDDALKDNEIGVNDTNNIDQEEVYVQKSAKILDSDTKNIDKKDHILKSDMRRANHTENLDKEESFDRKWFHQIENIEQEDDVPKVAIGNINQDILKADETGDNDTDSKDSNTKQSSSNNSFFSAISDILGSPYHSSTPSSSSKRSKSSKKAGSSKSAKSHILTNKHDIFS